MAYVQERTNQSSIPLAKGHIAFELRPLIERHHVLGLSWWLISRWPSRLRNVWKHKVVRYNVLGKDFDSAPEWYLAEVKRLISGN